MSDFHNRSQTSARRSDYVWQYEYYDDEEPVSFEGLKAHRYSIVIGFWVGLAVFVMFMFFVLTLLTKTGAPHQETLESAEKQHRQGSCLVDIGGPEEKNDKAFARPLLPESRSYFNFYISEGAHSQRKQKAEMNSSVKETSSQANQGTCNRPRGICSAASNGLEEDDEEVGHLPLEALLEEAKTHRDCHFLPHFNIPNFVNLEHSSSLGEDDLLYEPAVVLDQHLHPQDHHHDLH